MIKLNQNVKERKEYHMINFFSPDEESQQERAKTLREKCVGLSVEVIRQKDDYAIIWRTENKIDEFNARIVILQPHLKQTIWPPVSYMMIPSVLKAADDLIVEISDYRGTEKGRKEELLREITDLRKRFHVEK